MTRSSFSPWSGAAPPFLLPFLFLLAGVGFPGPAQAQEIRAVPVTFSQGEGTTLRAEVHRGYPALPASALEVLGWRARADGDRVTVAHRSGLELRFRLGSPYFRWEDDLLQLAHPPYRMGNAVYLPLQLVVDLFPNLLPRAYTFDDDAQALRVEGEADREAIARGRGSAPDRMAGARAADGPRAPDPPGTGPPGW